MGLAPASLLNIDDMWNHGHLWQADRGQRRQRRDDGEW